MDVNLEAIIRQSISELRNELGKQWLSNSLFGVRLHAIVATRISQIKPVDGWHIAVEKPIREIPFIEHELLDLTVEEYINGPGLAISMYRSELSRVVRLGSKLGDLIPDLVVLPPDRRIWVWDLTSRENEHLVKTILYANIITSIGQLANIGETYWLQKDGF